MKDSKDLITMPEYVIQKNAMSRAIYSCSANTRKLLAMAMSLLPLDISSKKDYTVKFTVTDFLKSLNITDGSKTRETVKAAIKETGDFKLVLKDELEEYEFINMFMTGQYSWGWDSIKYTFNPIIVDILKQLKGHSKLDLFQIGKLQSIYAIRFYEIALSYKGFAGKNGNKKNEWFFERTIGELRELFELKNKYKLTNDLKKYVVDNPIIELNNANVGFKIKLDYIRKGKYLKLIRFNCKMTDKDEIDVTPNQDNTDLEKQYNKLLKKYPEEFEELKNQELKKLKEDLFAKIIPIEHQENIAKHNALEKLSQKKAEK